MSGAAHAHPHCSSHRACALGPDLRAVCSQQHAADPHASPSHAPRLAPCAQGRMERMVAGLTLKNAGLKGLAGAHLVGLQHESQMTPMQALSEEEVGLALGCLPDAGAATCCSTGKGCPSPAVWVSIVPCGHASLWQTPG